MYGELDIFENHDDQFAHDGSSDWDDLIDDILEEIPFGDNNNE